MGQKVNPIGFRLGIIENWKSNWFPKGSYADLIKEDLLIRKFIARRFVRGGITKIEIEKIADRVKIILHSARPGIVIGRKGVEIDRLSNELHDLLKKQVTVDVKEIKYPNISAQFIANAIIFQIAKKGSHRYVIKRAIATAMQSGAKGIKIRGAGRLGGAEISRAEQYKDGRIPLHTLRADIDYGVATSHTKYGTVGIKVWVYKGEVFGKEKKNGFDAQKGKISQVPSRSKKR